MEASIFKDLEVLQETIPVFDLFEHDVAQWIATVKSATSKYDTPDDIMKFLHSFFKQDEMITWYVKQKHGKKKLDEFKDLLEVKVIDELTRNHKLADLHFDEFLNEIKYQGKARIQKFIQEKLRIFANLYPFFPKEKVHEKIFFQLPSDQVSEFLLYKKAKIKVILKIAAISDGVALAE